MKIAYDPKLKRPACALLQAVYGGDLLIASNFDTEDWLLHPTPNMGCFEITREQLQILIKKTKERDKNELH